MTLVTIVLIVLATLSPILTCTSLWQVKEWRVDRLMAHLKSEGMLSQLFGRIRPIILLISCALFALTKIVGSSWLSIELFVIIVLGCFSMLSAGQMIAKKQRLPVFTAKTCIILLVSLLIPMSITLLLFKKETSEILIIFLPVLAPLWVLLSWLIVWPLDSALKQYMLHKAKQLRKNYRNLVVIGITGSVGKTTTKEILAHILRKRGAIATPVHVNTEMGVAKWLQSTLREKPKDWPGTLIIEMGAYRKGEIRLLCDITKPVLGIITYIGKQHLALFGSEDALLQAKAELFESLPTEGHAFINLDNAASATLSSYCSCACTSVGTDGKADLHATDIEEVANGIRFKVNQVPFSVPIAGTQSISAILLAIAVTQFLKIDLHSIARELASFKVLPRSFEVKTMGDITVVDDTYNASPDSLYAAIAWAKRQPKGPKILITDGIIELGEHEATIHEDIAKKAAEVFQKVYIQHPRVRSYFQENGFGEHAQSLEQAQKIVSGLVVCVGRIQRSDLTKILPQ